MAVHDTTPLSRVLILRTSFIVHCMGPLGHPYPYFHPLNFLNIFYPPQFFIDFPHLLLYPTLLSFLFCICPFLLPFFSRMDFYCTSRMESFSTVSNFLLSSSNIPDYTSYCPIYKALWPCIFLAILC